VDAVEEAFDTVGGEAEFGFFRHRPALAFVARMLAEKHHLG